MTPLPKYYKIAALLPLGLTIISGMILSITHDGSNYKSEWFTDDGFVLTVFMTILLSGLIAILSLTIFLNNKLAIKENPILSFLSWIPIAGSACVFVIYQELLNFSGNSNINGVYQGHRLLDGYIMAMAIMHLFSLSATYIKFKAFNKL